MSIKDELKQTIFGSQRLEDYLQSQSDEDREEWLDVLRRGDLYTADAITKILRSRGVDVDKNIVYRYRTKLDGYVPRR